MYEHVNEEARKVMQLANQEAQRLNHEYIDTVHLLLGLVKEGSNTAASILKKLGIDLKRVTLEAEKLVEIGPEMCTMGKLPHTPRAKKVIEYAIMQARSLDHTYIGTEHLLLGFLQEAKGVAGQVLMSLGVTSQKVLEQMVVSPKLAAIGQDKKPNQAQELIAGVYLEIIPIEVATDPPVTVFSVVIEDTRPETQGVWNDAFTSRELLEAYLRGLEAGAMMIGRSFIVCPVVPLA